MNSETNNLNPSSAFLQAFAHYMQSGNSHALMPFVAKQTSVSPALLSIYRNGFFKGAISALESNFPSVKTHLSTTQFFAIAQTYVKHCPPYAASLVGYGFHNDNDNDNDNGSDKETEKQHLTTTHLPFLQHLKSQPDMEHTAWLFELGLLDEVWLKTLNAKNNPSQPDNSQQQETQEKLQEKQGQAHHTIITITDLQQAIEQGIDIATMPMALVYSSRIICLHYDVFTRWQASRFGAEDSHTQHHTQPKYLPMASPMHLLFWQQQNQVQVKILSMTENHFLHTLNSTYSMTKAEQAATAIDSQFDVSVLFAELLNGQLLQALPKP